MELGKERRKNKEKRDTHGTEELRVRAEDGDAY